MDARAQRLDYLTSPDVLGQKLDIAVSVQIGAISGPAQNLIYRGSIGVIGGQGIGIYDEVKQYLLRLYKGVAFGRQPPSLNKRILHQVASVQLVGTPWRFHADR